MLKGEGYFEGKRGVGVLSTANSRGEVDAAIYSRPHVLKDGTVAFVMRDRLTHSNLGENPHAVFLFAEEGYKGVRLYLTKISEEKGTARVEEFSRRSRSVDEEKQLGEKCVVLCAVDNVLPLVGTDSNDIPA